MKEGYIKPSVKKKQTWHLVGSIRSTGERSPRDCDAGLFLRILNERFFDTWSMEHPKLAKVFWPIIADMARDNHYLGAIDLLLDLRNFSTKNVKSFKNDLYIAAADAYLTAAEINFAVGDIAIGKDRLNKSLSLQPSDKAKQLLDSID